MSDSRTVCVGCGHPILDQMTREDLTLEFKWYCIKSKNLVVGSKNGCRNCSFILDAITTVLGQGRLSMEWYITTWPDVRDQELVIRIEEKTEIRERIEVIRYIDSLRDIEPSKSVVWNVKGSRPLSEDTCSQRTIRLIQEWTKSCMQYHNNCMQRLVVPLPKRILHITADHVFLREQPAKSAPYACLSHCWGLNGPAIKLTAGTVGYLRNGLRTSDLPKTFRDAVEVCRHLEIHYLWIDALCILQDCEDDWKEAAATMGDIYENSHTTIAATASQDSNGGLFSSDRPVTRRLNKHPYLYARTQLEHFPTYSDETVPTSMPLLTRACVYQERRLSHRTIHFGKHQVYWECQTGFASEDVREDRTWGTHSLGSGYAAFEWGDKSVDYTISWQKTVLEYTKLELTYESDRLPAIAALVDRMSKLRQPDDVYIAGMWKKSLLSDLLWESSHEADKPRPSRMAPSWSWASIQYAKVRWSGFAFPKQTKVTSLEYTPVGAANLGKVINASIILMVPVLDLSHMKYENSRTRFSLIFELASIKKQFRDNNLCVTYTSFDNDYELNTRKHPFVPGCAIKLLVAKRSNTLFGGIVVKQTPEKAAEHERIGFLSITVKTTTQGVQEENGKVWEGSVSHWRATKEQTGKGIDSLILSLPMEEVKIV